MKKHILTMLALLITLEFNTACKLVQPVFHADFDVHGGTVKLTIVGVDQETGEQVSKAIEEDFTYLDNNWRVGGGGELDLVNRLLPDGKIIAAPPSLLPLLGLSQRFATISGGLFDPATGGFVWLWGFNDPPIKSHPPPFTKAIHALLAAKPKMRDLDQDGILWRSNNPSIRLDFFGLLDGYGIDLAIARLREFGLNNAAVKFSGGIRVIGTRDGQPWHAAIHRPNSGSILAFVELSGDESLITVGNDERSFLYRRQRYNELIDPRTGYPTTHTKIVSVLHKNAVTADAAAHALFIAGPTEWPKVAQSMEINKVLLIDNENILHVTSAMLERLKKLSKTRNVRLIEPVLTNN